ncbi:MAG: hypothetical protein KDA81_15370 [Planctomycetaceae bacterium]|nr:hypothetical protein [Planctomycetaceae bacterium]
MRSLLLRDVRHELVRLRQLSCMKAALVAAILAFGAAEQASAQFGGDRIQRPLDRPTVSPYLNLFRGDGTAGSAVLNYYGLVKPQQQAIQQTQMLNMGLQNLQNRAASGNSPGGFQPQGGFSQLGITGHPTAFMTIGGGSLAGGGGGGFGGGGFGSSGFGGGFGSSGFGSSGFGGSGFGGGFGSAYGASSVGTFGVGSFSAGGGFSR